MSLEISEITIGHQPNIHIAPAKYLLALWEVITSTIILPSLGSTGYIDYLTPEDMEKASGNKRAAKGQDSAGRKCIAFLLDVWPEGQENKRRCVVTAFQRYADNELFWVTAGDKSFMIECEDEHRTSHEKISSLMMGEQVSYVMNKHAPELARKYLAEIPL
jgi:hypothetical protein